MNSRAGDRLEVRRRRLRALACSCSHVTAGIAGELRGRDGPVALAALFVRALDSQLQRPKRPRRRFASAPREACGMISNCVTEAARCRCDVPRQSAPVSPPPIMMHVLPVARIADAGNRRGRPPPAGSAAAGNPWRNGCPSTRARARSDRADARRRRPAGSRRNSTAQIVHLDVHADVRVGPELTPSAVICATRRSIRCFSILKSGMP